tara:strand:+ start:2670 stop:2849 length:180 start_codon:yes stop_codon:yes gene_type:complete
MYPASSFSNLEGLVHHCFYFEYNFFRPSLLLEPLAHHILLKKAGKVAGLPSSGLPARAK